MAQLQKASGSKVLSIVWYKVLPAKFGGQKAIANFNQALGEVTSLVCLCAKNNTRLQASYTIRNMLPVAKTQFINPFTWLKIYSVAKQEQATHLILEFPYHAIAGWLCKKFLRVKLVINTHNIEAFRFREAHEWWWRLLFFYERWAFKQADAIFFKTEADRTVAIRKFAVPEKKATVVPYGVDAPPSFNKEEAGAILRDRHRISNTQKILLFAGTLDYLPNAAAVVAIVEQLIPLLKAKQLDFMVIVCGRNKSAAFQYLDRLKSDSLIIAGDVPDIEAYFAGADLFINPVLGGGGIQTKNMDALSYHLNVVCFRSKAIAMENAALKLFVAEDGDWQCFAEKVNASLVKSNHTPTAFFKQYHWHTIATGALQKLSTI